MARLTRLDGRQALSVEVFARAWTFMFRRMEHLAAISIARTDARVIIRTWIIVGITTSACLNLTINLNFILMEKTRTLLVYLTSCTCLIAHSQMKMFGHY